MPRHQADRVAPRFVGVLIEDMGKSILLLKRLAHARYFSGIWCIPGGSVESGESLEEAAIREVYEETGLELSQLESVCVFNREGGDVVVFGSRVATLPTHNPEPQKAEAISGFAFSDLPEELGLESWLAIADVVSRHGTIISLDVLLERTFSALFYSYLWPMIQRTWPGSSTAPILFFTLRKTPFRKFKSGLVALLGECGPPVLVYAALAEIMFAAMYVYDDVCDNKLTRYGQTTARGHFGLTPCASFLLQIAPNLEAWWRANSPLAALDSHIADGIVEWIAQTCGCQDRRHFGTASSLDEYEAEAVNRTRFLGEIWCAGLTAAGFPNECDLMTRLYPLYALAGQLRNDLKEFDPASPAAYEDAARGVWTYPWIQWAKECSSTDLSWVLNVVWGKGTEVTRIHAEHLTTMVRESGALEATRRRVAELVGCARCLIANSGIDDAKIFLLDRWMAHQLERDVLSVDSRRSEQEPRLIKALLALTARAIPRAQD